MIKRVTIKVLVAAALFGVAAESAWAEEATPGVSPAPAGQAAAPGTGYAPGWYPPYPNRGGYAQPWQQQSQRPAPPPGYNQPPSYYPPYGQYQAVPAAPAENPLSAELKQTQEQLAAQATELDTTKEQLAAQATELDTTKEQLAKLYTELQTATAALQKAQSDTVNAGVQVDTTMTQVDTLKHMLCELAARIEARKTALENALQPTTAEPDDPGSATADEVDPEITEQAEDQTDPKCSQLTRHPAITSGQRAMTIKTPAK
jgi:hypothetical protein